MIYFKTLFDAVLPPRCPITGVIVDSQGTISPEAWGQLSFISAPLCTLCGFPFEFAVPKGSTDHLCAACLYDRPEFAAARSALVYNDASRDFILGFKHGDRLESVVAMVPWLKNAGAEILKKADVIVPVPLHRWRLLKRRYNQAALMGQALGKSVMMPVIADALLRTRSTPMQGHLNTQQRRANVKRAFTIHPRRKKTLQNKSVILIDDVYTTGATIRECTRALLEAGVKEVFVLTLARVVKAGRVD